MILLGILMFFGKIINDDILCSKDLIDLDIFEEIKNNKLVLKK